MNDFVVDGPGKKQKNKTKKKYVRHFEILCKVTFLMSLVFYNKNESVAWSFNSSYLYLKI